MSHYYCPFCSSRYQFHKTNSDDVLVCGQCGDPLIKKPLLNSRRIIGILTSLAFFAPLLLMFTFVLKDFIKEKRIINYESFDMSTLIKR